MLGTWRLDTKNENSMFMRQAIDPVTARPVVQQACNSCRAKKLRCTGEKTGCSRCKTLSRPCVYAQPAGKGSGRKKNKTDGKESKNSSGAGRDRETLKRRPQSPTATSKGEPQSASGLTAEPLAETSGGDPSAVSGHPMDFTMDLGDPTQDLGVGASLASFDLGDGFGKIRTGGSPSSIEQWLISSPPELDVVTDLDMDINLWTNSGVDPAAFSVITSPSMMTPPLSTLGLSTSAAKDSMRSSPTDDNSPASRSSAPTPKGDGILLTNGKATTPPNKFGGGLLNSNSSPTTSLQDHPCQCLQRVVFLIDELETVQDTAAAQLDAGLASHREALRYGEAMMLCGHCTSRPENMTILTFLTDRLAGLCERIVNGYFDLLPSPGTAGAAPTGRRPNNSLSADTTGGCGTSAGGGGGGGGAGGNGGCGAGEGGERQGSGSGRWGVFFGDYEVDSANEWELLVRNLIVLQLKALSGLMGRVKEVSGLMQCDTPWRKAVGTEKRIAMLLDRLNAMAAWDV
ncbi:hypothetical protein N656DRAFT_832267 [Canariomyces notabilis]|uniref:Zn(2)-C6 fungal-type domain-containing protein n=1 Tax=Canariomyces notabilis TaxID=2074819 RepID=A0AAN6QH05_9PEZI|nr:hypothetical protein N656DRAFT_832267 [Canariomyces arenarius]